MESADDGIIVLNRLQGNPRSTILQERERERERERALLCFGLSVIVAELPISALRDDALLPLPSLEDRNRVLFLFTERALGFDASIASILRFSIILSRSGSCGGSPVFPYRGSRMRPCLIYCFRFMKHAGLSRSEERPRAKRARCSDADRATVLEREGEKGN